MQESNIQKRQRPKRSQSRKAFDEKRTELLEREIAAKENYMRDVLALEREKVQLLRQLVEKHNT